MDVQGGQGRRRGQEHLSIPAIHDMSSYDCPIYPRITRSILYPLVATPTRLPQPARSGRAYRADRSEEAPHDQVVLLQQAGAVWCSHWHGHWSGQHELEIHLVDLFQYVSSYPVAKQS